MSKDFKNVLYLILIVTLCIVVPIYIPALNFLFLSAGLVYVLLVFFATQFAGSSRLASLFASLGMLLYGLFFVEKMFTNKILRPGLHSYIVIILLITLIIFVVEYITSQNTKKAIQTSLKSIGWMGLAFILNIVLTIFLLPAIIMLR